MFSVDEHIVLLEENTARNPEFDYVRFELADNSEYRANFTLKPARVSCISLKDSAVLRDKKKKTTKMYLGRASQK